MGILTDVSREVDEEEELTRVYAITKWGIHRRSQLNRVAGRAAVGLGVGQRTLVAAAYDEEGIDMVWKEGPFKTLQPEEKYPDAKKVEYSSMTIDSINNTSDFFEMLTPRLQDKVKFGETMTPEDEATVHVWEIPFGL